VPHILLFQALSINEGSDKATTGPSPPCETERNQFECASKHTLRKPSEHCVILLVMCATAFVRKNARKMASEKIHLTFSLNLILFNFRSYKMRLFV